MTKIDIVGLGELPDPGQFPKRMLAQVVRQDRFRGPWDDFRVEAGTDAWSP